MSSEGCDACALVDKAAGWLAWLEHRIDELDADAAAVGERLEVATASRDDIAHHVEHATLTPALLLELIAPFLASSAAGGTRLEPAATSTDRPAAAPRPVPPGVMDGLDRPALPAVGRRSVRPAAGGEAAHLDLPHPSAAVVLSGTGALLVLVAAIVFTVVSWGRLGEQGRVATMLGFLSVSAVATVVVHRRQLRWTAEALAWLTASLAAVEMAAMTAFDIVVRVDSMPVAVMLVALAMLVASVALGFVCRGRGIPLLQPWQAAPLAAAVAAGAWASGMGYEAERVWWSPRVAAVGALVALASRRVRQPAWWVVSAAASWFAASIWSLVSLDGTWLRLLGAVLSAALVLVGSTVGLAERVGRTTMPLGVAVSSPLLVLVPAVHFRGGGAVAVDVALAALGVVAVGTTWASATARLDRRLGAAAVLPLVGTAVVALDDATTGAVALGVLALVAGLWGWRSDGQVRAVAAAAQWGAVLLWCGYVARAAGLPARWSAVVVTMVASAALAISVRRSVRSDDGSVVLEATHFVALGLAGAGVLVEVANAAALAVGSGSISLASASLLDRRRLRLAALPVTAIAASIAWAALMSALGVTVVEAVTVPVGSILVFAGAVAQRWRPGLDSWILGPGLGIAALGTMGGIPGDEGGITRWLLLLVAGAAVATVGAWRRLLAPLVIGAVAALFAALSQLGPWAVGLPRWLTIGVVGAGLLVVGARFESVRAGLRRAAVQLRRLH